MILRRVTSVPVEHIALGGTLEFQFDTNKDTDIYPKETIVKQYIEKIAGNRSGHSLSRGRTVAMAESTEITEKIVKDAWEYMKMQTSGEHYLVTCGLKKIKEIGDMFADVVIGNTKKILLVGSHYPIENRWYSDAHFNLPYALAYLRYAMHFGEIVTFDGSNFAYHIKKEL